MYYTAYPLHGSRKDPVEDPEPSRTNRHERAQRAREGGAKTTLCEKWGLGEWGV